MFGKSRLLLLSSISLNIILLTLASIWLARRGGMGYIYSKISSLNPSPSPSPEATPRPRTTTPYYTSKIEQFEILPSISQNIVFLGDSITEQGEWSELFARADVQNRGISGDTTTGVLKRLEQITATQPHKLFIMIGINDIWLKNRPTEEIIANYRDILEFIQANTPETLVYIQSILPINHSSFPRFRGNNEQIKATNSVLAQMATEFGYEYIDLYQYFISEQDELDLKYTHDGIHLNGAGYWHWRDLIRKYIVKDS